MKVLAIETSCDETAVAVLKCGNFSADEYFPRFNILSNIVSSQVKIHAKWGGVVPNIAKREHARNLLPVLKRAMKKAGFEISNFQFSISPPDFTATKSLRAGKQFSNDTISKLKKIFEREPELLKSFLEYVPKIKKPRIDAVAVTIGPGLEPALWTGINLAKALSLVWGKPIIPINHMEGHLFSVLLSQNAIFNDQFSMINQKSRKKDFGFPAVALLVSGGHTELVLMRGWGKYKIIGQTRDDAAGEAFDKAAKLLGLGYPGGPAVAKMATEIKSQKSPARTTVQSGGNLKNTIQNSKFKTQLPRPMINSDDFDFSFSGLKTALLYKIRDLKKLSPKTKAELASEFQQATIDVLVLKTIRAAKKYKPKTIIMAGGVSANKELREQLSDAVRENFPDADFLIPELAFSGDNAAMIAAAGCQRARNKQFAKNPSRLKANSSLEL